MVDSARKGSSEIVAAGRGRHRFAVLLAMGVVLLISAGALVTSKGAGLSVPDWPLSYGGINPPRWWQIENVRAEHGHRLIAGTVALATVALALWIGRREPRRWVRRIAYLAVAAVFAQAALGGITVLLLLPTAVSVAHAGLAELFLCLVVTLAVVTSRGWQSGDGGASPAAARLVPFATTTSALIYLQILLGAVVRHSGAGLAIPDFPLAFGHLVPPRFDFPIGIHYAHRVGALVVLVAVAATVLRAVTSGIARAAVRVPASLLGLLVLLQVTLGATVVLTGKAVLPNTAHVATGATLLATSLVLTLQSWRLARGRRGRVSVPSAAGEAGRALHGAAG